MLQCLYPEDTPDGVIPQTFANAAPPIVVPRRNASRDPVLTRDVSAERGVRLPNGTRLRVTRINIFLSEEETGDAPADAPMVRPRPFLRPYFVRTRLALVHPGCTRCVGILHLRGQLVLVVQRHPIFPRLANILTLTLLQKLKAHSMLIAVTLPAKYMRIGCVNPAIAKIVMVFTCWLWCSHRRRRPTRRREMGRK